MSEDKEISFEVRVQATLMFLKEIGWQKAAEFVVHQQQAIDGLQANNAAYVDAYRKMLQDDRWRRILEDGKENG